MPVRIRVAQIFKRRTENDCTSHSKLSSEPLDAANLRAGGNDSSVETRNEMRTVHFFSQLSDLSTICCNYLFQLTQLRSVCA